MLKLIGIMLIVSGAGGYGTYLCSCLKGHLEQLIQCREIFAQMDAARECLKLPYAQLLRRAAKGKQKIFYEILNEIAGEMEKNNEADVGMLWETTLAKKKRQLLLKEEEMDLFLSLARSLMAEGNHAKVSEIFFMQLEDKITQAMEEKKEKQKLYGTVSVLGGLLLVILLL